MKNPFNPQATAILKAFCSALALCNAADSDGSTVPGTLASGRSAYGFASDGLTTTLDALGFPGRVIVGMLAESVSGDCWFTALCDTVEGWKSEAAMNAETAERVRDSVIENREGYDSESDYLLSLRIENFRLETCRETVRQIHDTLSAQPDGNKAGLKWAF